VAGSQGGGEGGQADDVVVGEVGDLDAAGDAAFGDQVAQPLIGRGMSVAVKPLPDQPTGCWLNMTPPTTRSAIRSPAPNSPGSAARRLV